MISPRQALRLMRINFVLVRHGLDEIVLATHLFRPIRFLIYLSPFHWFRSRNASRGERIRRALEDLGPIFVKFGQMLSTRRLVSPSVRSPIALCARPLPFRPVRKVSTCSSSTVTTRSSYARSRLRAWTNEMR